MGWFRRYRAGLFAVILLVVDPAPAPAQRPNAPHPLTSIYDPRLSRLREASIAWELRQGPPRQVVDLVCLVPDVPTFFEAIATWDQHHYFPILLDDVEYACKFLQAFRPSRVVRFPTRAREVADEALWQAAIAAVGRSWSSPESDARLSGDAVPGSLGPTPPGVVLASPDSPMLAGAVALAAGRFQPLVLWNVPKTAQDTLSPEEATTLAGDLERTIAQLIPNYDALGDDCDFVTLAGDWPYRVKVSNGINAFDDLIGRRAPSGQRWMYAGRLLGDPVASVYRAMCSLFLQPRSALLFNGYPLRGDGWSDYTMDQAARNLEARLPTTHRAGPGQADLSGWHHEFDPINRHGLVIVNSRGGPAQFGLAHGSGQPDDVPMSRPSAVVMIHSFSAARPHDRHTVAGRWLANGAFLYYGSVHEPYLQAFRPPALASALIAEHLPFSAALRQSPETGEPFGAPWRLLYLGDPLYRLRRESEPTSRLSSWEPVADWPSYRVTAPPADADDHGGKLVWVLQTALASMQTTTVRPATREQLAGVLLTIDRQQLPASRRPVYDALLAVLLWPGNSRDELRARLAQIPEPERTDDVARWIATSRLVDLYQAMAQNSLPRTATLWDELLRSPGSLELKKQATRQLVATIGNSPARLDAWHRRLRATLRAVSGTPEARLIEEAIGQLEKTREQRMSQ